VTILGVLAAISGILMLIAGSIIGFGAAIILGAPSSEFRDYAAEELGPQAQSIGVPVDLGL